MRDNKLVQQYMSDGMSYAQACSMAGVQAEVETVAVQDVDDGSSELTDEELIELNGTLAIRVVHRALKFGVSGEVDSTVLNAAVRAVNMLEEQRKSRGGTSAEDDMLKWVDEVMHEA